MDVSSDRVTERYCSRLTSVPLFALCGPYCAEPGTLDTLWWCSPLAQFGHLNLLHSRLTVGNCPLALVNRICLLSIYYLIAFQSRLKLWLHF